MDAFQGIGEAHGKKNFKGNVYKVEGEWFKNSLSAFIFCEKCKIESLKGFSFPFILINTAIF